MSDKKEKWVMESLSLNFWWTNRYINSKQTDMSAGRHY